MKTPFIALIIAGALLAGCATSYQETGITGGHSATRLSPDQAMINFQGNGFTSADRARDFALLRAAELCLAGGYQYIQIVTGEADETHTQLPSTVRTSGSFNANTYDYGYGSSTTRGRFSGRSRIMPGAIITKPSQFLYVKFHVENPNNNLLDARFLDQELRTKYKLENN
jgi:hypothetical protein